MNARFWYWMLDGWIKITLKPGQKLTHTRYTRNEEAAGWSSEVNKFEHDGEGVIHRCASDGADCDGRHSTYYESSCPLHALQALPPNLNGNWPIDVPRPDWRDAKSSQRDYSAEAMNY